MDRIAADRNTRHEVKQSHRYRCLSEFKVPLGADTTKGNRPSFAAAASPEVAEPLYHRFCDALVAEGVAVETGAFGARMEVALVNDGPVTVILDQ